jgi:cytochrome c peroxidase
LLTPAPFDRFLAGDSKALSDEEKKGLKLFVDTGCPTCHNGMGIGGNAFMVFGVAHPYKKPRGPWAIQRNQG